jgi:uncharacterized protein (TIGR03067 family)
MEWGNEEKFKGKTSLGIYELKKGELKWCAAEPGGERPKDFATAGTKNLFDTLRREQK